MSPRLPIAVLHKPPEWACPYCGGTRSRVLDTDPSYVRYRRWRKCLECKKRFKTREITEPIENTH